MTPLDVPALQKGLRLLHGRLTEDLVARADLPEVAPVLKETHARLTEARRTGADYLQWRRHLAAQVASAWVLSTLFVRVLEDRGFLPRRRLAGEGAAGEEAREGRETLDQLAPLGPREYLLLVFQELMTFEATRPLFDPAHNLAWRLGPSQQGARALLEFWAQPDPAAPGRLLFAFDAARAPGTRFLGDVYEELDPDAKKRFALLQTPDFVERFLLDRTLEPALAVFGLTGDPTAGPAADPTGGSAVGPAPGEAEAPLRLIDPSCGSGHFLLGAFERLVRRWSDAAPDAGPRAWATRALASVHGTDLNPYAVAITRFRLTLAAFEAAGVTRLAGAPAFPLNVTVADALLWGGEQAPQRELRDRAGAAWSSGLFDVEDLPEVERLLLETRYHVVVGNPPYITPKDPALNAEYRARYPRVCHRTYSLAVPFTQRFFLLAREGGFVGMITANSFMKREFGKPLIERFLPEVDLTAIYDTSGAFIPGHGTPTVLLVGRNERPRRRTVPVAMSKRGEPGKPDDPSQGLVWASIARHGDEVGFENDYLSVSEVERTTLAVHPWSLGGGGAAELKERLERRAPAMLQDLVSAIGRTTKCGDETAYLLPTRVARYAGFEGSIRSLVSGELVRDWGFDVKPEANAIYPYVELGRTDPVSEDHPAVRVHLWLFRALLARRTIFQATLQERGQAWFAHLEHYHERLRRPEAIGFAFVATHNHFAYSVSGALFDSTAPAIKLPAEASEDDHLRLLGLLNSSTLGFWMRQVFFPKGLGGVGGGFHPETWSRRLEYDGTKLGNAPIVLDDRVLAFARALDRLGQSASAPLLADLAHADSASPERLRDEVARRLAARRDVLGRMRGLQEELDWLVYQVYGLLPAGVAQVVGPEAVEPLALGLRPFEVALARQVAAGELTTAWFERHGSTAHTELPAGGAAGGGGGLSPATRARFEARLALLERVAEVGLIERPEYKRRWSKDDLEARAQGELRERLLDRLEDELRRADTVQSVRALARALERDPAFRAQAQVYAGQLDVGQDDLVGALLEAEAVPAFDACRYTATGLEKRAVWEEVWALQRREDQGERVEVPVPPKYQSKDFQGHAWTHRGKLDVPKERFVSYPGCEGTTAGAEGGEPDPTPVYGWAGWDHAQRARALADLFERRRTEDGWDRARLVPLLAGIQELLPWLLQWHAEPSEAFGGERPGEAFAAWLEAQRGALSLSPADLRAWRPEKGRGRSALRSGTRRAGATRPGASRAGATRPGAPRAGAPRAGGPPRDDDPDDEAALDDEHASPDDPDGPDGLEPGQEPPGGGANPADTARAEASPRRPRGRPPARQAGADTIDPDRVLAALTALGGAATLAALTEAVGAPQKAVRAAADALVAAGRLTQPKLRPITYASAPQVGS